VTIVESSLNAWKHRLPRRASSAALLVLALAAGCGGVPKTHFYTLQAPPAPAPADPKTSYVLGVERFRAPEILRDDRVAYFVSQTEMNFYQYHRWASNPATLLADFAAQWLESTGVFAQVKMLPFHDHVDYVLGGRVQHFEEVDSGGAPQARLSFALTLERTRDHRLVWSGEQHVEAPLSAPGVEGVASALNASCAQAWRELAPGLLSLVEQDYKTSEK
jgi:ABC-type uncharacterized transport system auxiliary subunit